MSIEKKEYKEDIVRRKLEKLKKEIRPEKSNKQISSLEFLIKQNEFANYQLDSKISTKILKELLGWNIDQIKNDIVDIKFLWKNIIVHKYLKEVYTKTESEIKSSKIASKYKIKLIDSFIERNVRNYPWTVYRWQISTHALWIGIDINPNSNKLESVKNERNLKNVKIPKEFIDIMKNNWFIWWWDWQTPFDPMHFEYSIYNNLNYQKLKYEVEKNRKKFNN